MTNVLPPGASLSWNPIWDKSREFIAQYQAATKNQSVANIFRIVQIEKNQADGVQKGLKKEF